MDRVSDDQVVLLEKERDTGGLCRSQEIDGAPLDIGGGHFLDVRNNEALQFLFRFMPRHEWNVFDRISRIRLRGQEIDYPLEANLWQFSKSDQVDYLESVAQAGCVRGVPMPELFSDWVTWKLGHRIADEYMLPYNRKIWSMDLDELGTYWLHKLPDVSFRDMLRSCLEGSPFGTLPAHGNFLYPKNMGMERCGAGWGRHWERILSPIARWSLSTFPLELSWTLACGYHCKHCFLVLLSAPAGVWFAGLLTTHSASLELLLFSCFLLLLALIFTFLLTLKPQHYWNGDSKRFFRVLHSILLALFAVGFARVAGKHRR